VIHGIVESVDHDSNGIEFAPAIDKRFDRIEHELGDSHVDVTVRPDPVLGFPVETSFDIGRG